MLQSGMPFTFDPKIFIALVFNKTCDAELITIDAPELVHQLKERLMEGFIGSNPNKLLVKRLLSLLEHETVKGIHNEFRNWSYKHGQ